MTGQRSETRTADCVLERARRLDTDEPLEFTEVWHIARHRGRTEDFCPIRCSTDEGIILPGPIQRRIPTCPDCAAVFGRQLQGGES